MKLSLQPVEDAPSDWIRLPLQAIGNQHLERNKGLRNDNLLSLSYGLIKNKDIDSNEGLLPESFETYQLVQPGDIIFRFTDLQNDLRSLRSAIVTEPGIITSAYLCFRPNPKKVSPQYLNYLMRAYDLAKVFYAFGGGVRQSLKYDEVRNLPIALPPRAEQDAIVEFLDRELEQIDSLVEKHKKLVELSKERLRSAISGATSPPVPGISAKWREAKVSELGTLTNGYPFDSNTFSHEGELPLVRIRDLKASEFETYIPKGSCPQSHVIQDGDLLIGMDGDFNAVLWSRGIAALNQRVARLRFKSPDVATYVVFAIQDKLDRINELTYSTTVKHLSSGQIVNIKISMPPNEELSDEAKKLTQLAKSMGEMVRVSENLVVTLIERRQALISAAVTGKLELQGQADG